MTIVIACGVATAVMSFSVLRSLAETRSEYYERYRFADVFATLHRAPESVGEAIARIPGVARVQTRLVADIALEMEDIDEPVVGRLLSLPERAEPAVNAIALRQGRAIAPGHQDEIIVSESFATAHRLIPGARLRAMVGGRKLELSIVGIALSPEYVYALGPGMIAPDDRRFGVLWMGRAALEAALDRKAEFNEVSLQLSGSVPLDTVVKSLEVVLKPYGGVGAYGRSQQGSHAFVSAMLDQLANVGRIVPPIFLAIVAFLAHTIMGRLIDTERQYIGLLKALGVGDRDIGWHYLKLALALSVLGVGLGLAVGAGLGYGLTEIYAQFFHFPFLRYRHDPVISAAAGLAAAGAMIAGTYRGVRRAASLPPGIAMARAAPPGYRKTQWEKLVSGRRLSEPTRMIVRHLARWPLRAALAICGLSLAVALQISMLFSFDALDYMINRFYRQAQRQDLTVFFAEPQPSAVANEAMGWPGVLKAEGYRTIPVRVSFGSRTRVVNLTGLQSTATLSHLLDGTLTPIEPTSSGIILSRKLAAVLGAEIGDIVDVELIGLNLQAKAPVVRLAEQYIGLDAYMDFNALNRFIDDGARITGVHLQIDTSQRTALHRALKAMPAMAGVTDPAVVLASFQNTMARTLTIIVSFFVGFAGLAALGIVYSNARIILSEREPELAILTALGFSAGEVAYVFVGE